MNKNNEWIRLLQDLFSTTAPEVARKTGFIVRQRDITAFNFITRVPAGTEIYVNDDEELLSFLKRAKDNSFDLIVKLGKTEQYTVRLVCFRLDPDT
ncbi:MAG: hypothetical protein LBQ66_07710, partial [Planctomycetaceae bacterium]|nr:hypothetical protein [Planctomycetaceae bacterium]